LATSIGHLEAASQSMLEQVAITRSNREGKAPATASAVPFLTLFGLVLEGWLLAQQALLATQPATETSYPPAFLAHKIALARFFMLDVLLETTTLHKRVLLGESNLV